MMNVKYADGHLMTEDTKEKLQKIICENIETCEEYFCCENV